MRSGKSASPRSPLPARAARVGGLLLTGGAATLAALAMWAVLTYADDQVFAP